jgi:hypothetical protein
MLASVGAKAAGEIVCRLGASLQAAPAINEVALIRQGQGAVALDAVIVTRN